MTRASFSQHSNIYSGDKEDHLIVIKMFFKLVTNVSATDKRVAKSMKELQ